MITINKELFLLEQKSFNAVFYDGDRWDLATEEAADYIISAMEKQLKGYSLYYCFSHPCPEEYDRITTYQIKKSEENIDEKDILSPIKRHEIEYVGKRYYWKIYSMTEEDLLLRERIIEFLPSACCIGLDRVFRNSFFFVVKDEINYECLDDYLKILAWGDYLPSFRKEVMEFLLFHKIYPIGIRHGCEDIEVHLYGDKGDWRRNYYLNRRKKKK